MRTAFLILVLLAGCASSEEISGDEPVRRRGDDREGLALTAPQDDVRTVQLFRTGDETALPILAMRSGTTLTLAFDLLGPDSRPLSVYFYHANRRWRRDLVPAEYLETFHRDDLLDYRPSRAVQVRYTHYRYAFPNASINFRISGNYIIRVTEQGMEESVLFERPFFVSEQATPLEFGIDQVRIPGQPYAAIQPEVRFTPPDPARSNAFDFEACFVRNGAFSTARCAARPSLAAQPAIGYYLEPETAFLPEPAEYFLDLSRLQTGSRIVRADLASSPFFVELEPDYARFPGTAGAPLQNGQAVVNSASRFLAEPSTGSEYADVRFSWVPLDETPISGDLYVVGSFNRYRRDHRARMVWVPERGRYEVTLLLKQGRYEYRYDFTDARQARASIGATPRFENLITAMIYFADIQKGTDRIITTESVIAR